MKGVVGGGGGLRGVNREGGSLKVLTSKRGSAC